MIKTSNHGLLLRGALAILAIACSNSALAECEFDVEVGDTLAYSTTSIEADASCESVTINLTHTGTLPAAAMGHNWVLSKPDDVQEIGMAGVSSGLDGNYLPADDARILAASSMIGGGESTSVTFSTAALAAEETYMFFCSFPGHWGAMRGDFKLK
ncbi:MAG: azurin [Pseudomonadota bacterium]